MESELVALTACSLATVHLRRLCADFGFPQAKPTPIAEDNQSCLQVANNVNITKRARHIPLRYFKCRELINDKEIRPFKVASADNPADLGSKSVDLETLLRHRSTMLKPRIVLDGKAL